MTFKTKILILPTLLATMMTLSCGQEMPVDDGKTTNRDNLDATLTLQVPAGLNPHAGTTRDRVASRLSRAVFSQSSSGLSVPPDSAILVASSAGSSHILALHVIPLNLLV